jgi:hypothetical protein
VTIVQKKVPLIFAPFLGFQESDIIATATAAAKGDEQQGVHIGAMALDTRAIPGAWMTGQGCLSSNGSIVVNSRGSGYDENWDWVDHGYGCSAVRMSGQGGIYSDELIVHGGVSSLSDISNYIPGEPHPLRANRAVVPDPLADLPTEMKFFLVE